MLAYGIVSACLVMPLLLWLIYQGFKKYPIALLLAMPFLMAAVYMGLVLGGANAPLALGVVALILMGGLAFIFTVTLVICIVEDEDTALKALFLIVPVAINTIVYLGCAL